MTRALRVLLVALMAVSGLFVGGAALADIDNSSSTNLQEGDNDSAASQEGDSSSGDAVGGQVTGVVSDGDTTVDATNESDDVDITTGNATGVNEASHFVGLNANGSGTNITADITNVTGLNVQEGDNSLDLAQTAVSSTGDGVGGQVIGAVTSSGGSAAIVAQNTSTEIDVVTGDSDTANLAALFVGLNYATQTTIDADITNASASNVQEGDNSLTGTQDAVATTGDGVGGQVLGVVSAGNAELDATNVSDDVDLVTGDASTNDSEAAYFVGLNFSTNGPLNIDADISGSTAQNLQEGNNTGDFAQSAVASTGDAVGGQVSGVVTSAGGSADVAIDNTSTEIDAATGNATFDSDDGGFIGLNVSSGTSVST